MKPAKKRRVAPLHPLLVAVFPLLAFYAHNLEEVPPTDLLTALGRALLISLLIWAILLLLYRQIIKSAIGASAVLLALVSYGHLTDQIAPQFAIGVASAEIAFCIFILISLFKTRQPLWDTTMVLNVAAGFLLLSPCWQIGSAYWRALQPGDHFGEHLPIVRLTGSGQAASHGKSLRVHGMVTAKSEALPDVYYIILDAYGRADSLKLFYGYDNTAFVRALERRGFYVPARSLANYDHTPICLSSSLKLTYLDKLAKRVGPSGSLEACREMLDDNRVAATLSPLGYQYIFIGSGASMIRCNTADIDLNKQTKLPLLDIGAFGPNSVNPMSLVRPPQYDQHRANLNGVFDSLQRASEMPIKKFVFAHVLAPHPPFVFGPNGEPKYPDGPIMNTNDGSAVVRPDTREQYMRGYIEQLQYINKRTLETVDAILAHSSRPPIIIVQGDHGSRMNMNWDSVEKTDLREPFSILNAYYVPNKVRGHLYETISPVNSFRIVLTDVFGANYKLLPDRSFYSTAANPYGFTDVTARTPIVQESSRGNAVTHPLAR